jgi:hypothetical protein
MRAPLPGARGVRPSSAVDAAGAAHRVRDPDCEVALLALTDADCALPDGFVDDRLEVVCGTPVQLSPVEPCEIVEGGGVEPPAT